MSGLKKLPHVVVVPETPEQLLYDLPKRKIKGPLVQQSEVLRSYHATALAEADVALQLPTGSGKTLVGLLIAEWKRRKFKDKVVYLCPTVQLVSQVVEQANEQYGLSVIGFTGLKKNFDPVSRAKYLNGDAVAVTTYSHLFNTRPFFEDPDTIILDDSHATENAVSSLWSLRVDQSDDSPSGLHVALANIIKPYIGLINYNRLLGQIESMTDLTWSEKLSTPDFQSIKDEIRSCIDTHVADHDFKFSWSMIRDHLNACHLYMSPRDILIRPIIPPTWEHAPFSNAKQRIFMSATLSKGGDLERLTGKRKIKRLPVPEGWDRQGIGRRFFLFPEMSLTEDAIGTMADQLMKTAGRSVVLVPNTPSANKLKAQIESQLHFRVFGATEIEQSKKAFTTEPKAVAIIANRYDGIDFPGSDCMLLFVDGLPRATNSQERFLMYRMAAVVLYNERVQTRILQAIGRCTRSSEDRSAVVITGDELTSYLMNKKIQSYLHPELQAEIQYGITQSKEASTSNYDEYLQIFLENGDAWEGANNDIVTLRNTLQQESLPGIKYLEASIQSEVRYVEKIWNSDYEEALVEAENVLKNLDSDEVKGYRAWWHYLAGSAAWLAKNEKTARTHYQYAKNTAPSVPWLITLSRFALKEEIDFKDKARTFKQIENIETVFMKLGTDRKFDQFEKTIFDGLDGRSSFENAHRMLGELIGFDSRKVETKGSPDPFWILNDICFVFEDHANAKTDTLDTTKARQAFGHPNWIKKYVGLDEGCTVIAVLVTPVSKADDGALPHLDTVLLWNLDEFKTWARTALSSIREIRRKFVEPSNDAWRREVAEIFEKRMIDANSILKYLKGNIASKMLGTEKN